MKAILLSLVVLVVCVFLVGAYLYRANRLSGLAPSLGSGAAGVPAAAGSIAKISSTAINVQTADGKQASFSINASTTVESVVVAGATGKTLADLAAGDIVAVTPSQDNQSAAATISLMPPLVSTPDSADGTPAQVIGLVHAASSGVLTLTNPSGAAVEARVPGSVAVLTRVRSGEKGKMYADIAPGMMVEVSGTTGTGGFVAQTILILSVPQQP